jgi:uncharacterized membrane protein
MQVKYPDEWPPITIEVSATFCMGMFLAIVTATYIYYGEIGRSLSTGIGSIIAFYMMARLWTHES